MKRRGFIATLLTAPLVVKVKPGPKPDIKHFRFHVDIEGFDSFDDIFDGGGTLEIWTNVSTGRSFEVVERADGKALFTRSYDDVKAWAV